MKKGKEGFIVHPFETGDGGYHSSYGNHNKTIRSFKTLRKAKQYLSKHGYSKALYDNPSGVKTISTKIIRRKPRKKKLTIYDMEKLSFKQLF